VVILGDNTGGSFYVVHSLSLPSLHKKLDTVTPRLSHEEY